jgi:hypothetical protein
MPGAAKAERSSAASSADTGNKPPSTLKSTSWIGGTQRLCAWSDRLGGSWKQEDLKQGILRLEIPGVYPGGRC